MFRKRSFNVSNSANCTSDNHFRMANEIPAPAALFVFIDTNENDIWDSTFATFPMPSYWETTGSIFPPSATSKAAPDVCRRHAEHWKWRTPKRRLLLGTPHR